MSINYELKIAEFQGPIEKLLEFIEEKNLEITRLNLAEVTSDFLKYLKMLDGADSKIIADFIIVAAQLILIKSHALLPNLELAPDEEKSISDLENRLRLYKEFRGAERVLQKSWLGHPTFSRDFIVSVPRGFYLTEPLYAIDLLKTISLVTKDLETLMPPRETQKIKLINFEEKVKELMVRIEKTISSSFKEIISGKERSEIIVIFLALLHLLKDSLIKINQESDFGDIKISKTAVDRI